MNRFFVLLSSCLMILMASCTPSGPKLKPLKLLKEGVPFDIKAPADTVTKVDTIGVTRDITLKGGDGYSIQIFETEALRLDPSAVVDELKTQVEDSPFFSKWIIEDEDGFVYEKKIDEDYINYDFRHVKIRGDKQYVVQSGFGHKATLDQAKLMYQSVQ